MPATFVDVRTPPPPVDQRAYVAGYAGVVLEVGDLARARQFYETVFDTHLQEISDGARLALGHQQLLLAARSEPRTLPETATHVAFTVPRAELEAIQARVQLAGGGLDRYHEDREAERDENRYSADPDGNRFQIVAGSGMGIDHLAVETHDLEWAETFYTQVLGARVESRIGWRMDDYDRAKAWGAGQDECAPGCRRWDKRYSAAANRDRLARPNAHLFVQFANGSVLGLYLATEHRQEPPLDQFIGTPRMQLRVRRGCLNELVNALRNVRLRCMVAGPSGGPFERHGDTVFVRDPAGNFLELSQ